VSHLIVVPFKLEERRVPLLNLEGDVVRSITLPKVFSLPVRKDIIRRAFHAAHTARIQPKGRDLLAGKRRVGESWGIGHSVARVPRLDSGRAVLAPNVRGGRLAHPPRVVKRIHENVNKKERLRAIASAIAATADPVLVRDRGHKFGLEDLPVIVTNDIESVDRASIAREVLKALKVWDDVVRAGERTRIRAGKGKMRGRRYLTPKSVLIVLSDKEVPAVRAFRNLPGVDVCSIDALSILHLAPGGVPGRLTIYDEGAIKAIERKFEVVTP